jgi:hypothetical protein
MEITNMETTDNNLSAEQLNKMSIEEILAFNGFKEVNDELVCLEEINGNISYLEHRAYHGSVVPGNCTTLTLTAPPAVFTAGTPVGPSTSAIGTAAGALVYTVLVTNTGGTAGVTNISLYEGVANTLISTKPTPTPIAANGGTYTMSYTVDAHTWAAGTYNICSKVGGWP